ncbi:hypothetical protein GCM10009807_21790 [Microbacterium lacus]|uniref:Uncharacterized protein n=1 Tax=Microbacterium lacus TaxID=415217 RepID=A0ABN2GVY8_9MICO
MRRRQVPRFEVIRRDDPRDFFAWRLPVGGGADMLSDAEVERLRALPESVLLDLLERTERAAVELRSLSAQLRSRWRTGVACPVCGGFVWGRSDKRYCSGACRQRAHAERRRSDLYGY